MIEVLSLNLNKQYQKKWNNNNINVVPLFYMLHCTVNFQLRPGMG